MPEADEFVQYQYRVGGQPADLVVAGPRGGHAVKRLVTSALLSVLWLAAPTLPALHAREGRITSINLTAFCDQCEANKQGMVIVDNIVFEK
jgi:hypothetical protein